MVTAGRPAAAHLGAATSECLRASLRRLVDEPLVVAAALGQVMAPYRRWQFHSYGAGSLVIRPTWLYGTRHVAIGDGVLVMPGAWLAVERPAWDRPAPVLVIGNRVAMRAHCTLSAAESVVIEDDVVFGGSVTVVDSDHTWRHGNPNVLYNPLETAPVRIGRGSWVGDHTTVLRGASIGELCLIGANSVVRGHIPDRSIAAGSPAKVIGPNRLPESLR